MSADKATASSVGVSVRLKDVRKNYGHFKAVEGIDLDVAPGELFSIVGPSGSGKSTLLHLIAGFTAPSGGVLEIGGSVVNDIPSHKRSIGVIFQNYSLFPHMSAAENIAFPLELRKVRRDEVDQRVAEALELVQMEGANDKYPAQLSGGQQQRIAIARAIVFRPHLLLMDEPMSALDRQIRAGLQLEFKNLQRKLGVTMIYVTHDQQEAFTMSNRMAVLSGGRVVQVGTPSSVYEDPTSLVSARFLGENSSFHGEVTSFVDTGDGRRPVIRLANGYTTLGKATHLAEPRLGAVNLNIRSERVRVTTQLERGATGVGGVVLDIVYGGDRIRYFVDCPSVGVVVAALPLDRVADPLHAGAAVTVCWDPEDLSWFPSEDRAAEFEALAAVTGTA